MLLRGVGGCNLLMLSDTGGWVLFAFLLKGERTLELYITHILIGDDIGSNHRSIKISGSGH